MVAFIAFEVVTQSNPEPHTTTRSIITITIWRSVNNEKRIMTVSTN